MNTIALAYVLLGASLVHFSIEFMLDGQSGNIQEVTHELLKLQTDVAILKDMVANLQQSCPSCAVAKSHPAPAFMATLTNSLACSADAPLVFDRVVLDTRMSYDVRHGTFRSSVNGTYVFSATLSGHPGETLHVKMVKNKLNNEIGYIYKHDSQTGWTQSTTVVVVQLSNGDDVWLACFSAGNIAGSNGIGQAFEYHSHFSGFLIDAF
ncbi:complement C1q tumor necrosis factor-related protein 4-like [Dreissena polymorpha]|uniref:complement C1q tumor necrosis factor-related protein 4-like n=1 Tax=Dreissena polymorpha TaxID=45954 RepID=UPI002263B0C2|nr:complement C1q tumor necrosis factor-related protein 4-like [Dreissena polymorpha]